MNTLIVAALVVFAIGSGASAQLVSSDPDFRPEGPPAYKCTTPKGKKTTCNRWQGTVRKSGWQRKCVRPFIDSMLMNLPGEGKEIHLDTPETGCAMLFHENWADTRNWAAKNQTRERNRILQAGYLNQYVQVGQAGLHEFGACMVRDITEYAGLGSGGNGLVNTGGMIATLTQWHQTDTATVQAVLPNNKVRFGPQDDPLVNIPHRINYWEEVPEVSTPGDLIGITDYNEVVFYYASGDVAGGYRAEQMWGQVLDGFEGHSGTGGSYNGNLAGNPGLPAYWTCYQTQMHLEPGFYMIRAEVQPYFYNVADVVNDTVPPEYVSDYTGYGALSNIYLSRVP